MPKRKPLSGLPEVHKDLKGYSLDINAFGEVRSNFDIERINDFLNNTNDDKKIKKSEKSRGRKHNTDEKKKKNGSI